MKIAITGANGYIGSRLCARIGFRGADVHALVRDPSRTPPGARTVSQVDLAALGDLRGDLAGVDVVVHLAAGVHHSYDHATYMLLNRDGTRALAKAAARAGSRRFVLLSTIAVHQKRDAVDERSPLLPDDSYGRSKLEGERALAEVAARSGMETVVVRPPMVFGPGAPGNFERLVGYLQRGIPIPAVSSAGRRSYLYIEHLLDALELAARPGAPVGAFTISDRGTMPAHEFARALGRSMGHPARTIPVPGRALRLVARLAGRTRDADRLLRPLVVSSEGFSRAFGWEPKLDLGGAVVETGRALRGRGL